MVVVVVVRFSFDVSMRVLASASPSWRDGICVHLYVFFLGAVAPLPLRVSRLVHDVPRSTTVGALQRGKDWRRSTRGEPRLLDGATVWLLVLFVTVCCVLPFPWTNPVWRADVIFHNTVCGGGWGSGSTPTPAPPTQTTRHPLSILPRPSC